VKPPQPSIDFKRAGSIFQFVELRARLLTTFGLPLADADAQERSLWREIIKTDWPERFSAATLQAQQQF